MYFVCVLCSWHAEWCAVVVAALVLMNLLLHVLACARMAASVRSQKENITINGLAQSIIVHARN